MLPPRHLSCPLVSLQRMHTCFLETTLTVQCPAAENPAITTRCNHQFHLACIYEWLERSQTCPICSQRLEFDELV